MGARVVEQLALDAKQQKAWEAISADLRQKSMAVFASASGDRKAIREAMTKNMGAALGRLEPLLRPEQKTKLVALRATMAQGRGSQASMRAGTVYVMRDEKPTPIVVRVGATDGSATEIVSRGLKAGDQVIVGGGPRPKAQFPRSSPGGSGGGVRAHM